MNQEYSEAYSERGFGATMTKLARTLGEDIKELALKAMTLYYCVKDAAVPTAAKVVIVGALGYLIMPFDLTPDFIPGVGWLDDLIVIRSAYIYSKDYVTSAHRDAANAAWSSKKRSAKESDAAEVADVVQEGPIT